jgi:uncharacterized protein
LISFNERKGYSVVIISLPKLSDKNGTQFTIEEVAQRYFNKWGIGDSIKNDGVLIMLSKEPRRVRIQTGSGMATLLTDDDCQNIIDSSIVPAFKAGLYFTGLKEAVKEIETVIANNEAANKAQAETAAGTNGTQPVYGMQNESPPEEDMTSFKVYYGFIVLGIAVWLFFSYKRKKAASGQAAVYSSNGYSKGGNVNEGDKVISNNTVHGGRRKSWFNSGGSSSGSSWFSGKGGSW